MVSCAWFCHALKQLPALEQMGNLSFWCYLMGSAHVGNGLWHLEIYLIFNGPFQGTLHGGMNLILHFHELSTCMLGTLGSGLWKSSDPDPKTFSVWTQNMNIDDTKQKGDAWRHPGFPQGWNIPTFFWSLCREVKSEISPPEFRSGLLPGEISLVCGFVYADLSITCFLGWELFAQA